ncbi:coiled-coil domain-containing protein [Sphingomonas radiodurans]|uniref:hypothetical protein n=1 Tax=Sphingomonas radiodurans TaxID=2890321 RepID=UPI001E5A3AD6|nr:hypothetical protein [Sphingomonas radiodurans]WBH17561.1 hypothetical protein LLW23_05490 [Sphingomonas radiodurans]
MTGGPSIIDIRTRETGEAISMPEPEPTPDIFEHYALADDSDAAGGGYVAPSLWRSGAPIVLATVAAAWVVALLWMARNTFGSMSALDLAQFGAALATVPALAGIAWLIALRTSRAEATRFGASARAMRAEAAALEQTVATLAGALEDNRHRLADQVRQFSAIGDGATARLAAIGRGLSEEIDQADVHARSLAEAAGTAQNNLAVLLATMPRAQAEVDAMAGKIDLAGLSAGEHTAALDAQVVALGERGREAETIAGGAAQKLAAHIARMEATSETAGVRLEGVTGEMSVAVDALLARIADAVDESRKGIAAQGEAMLAMVGANQAALDAAARETAESLAERIGVIEIVIDRIAARLDVQRAAGDGLVGTLEGGIARVETQLDRLHHQGVERSQHLAASISALGGSADAMTQALAAGDAMATKAIATTDNLLVALDAATREIDETLPAAVDRLDARVIAAKAVVVAAKPELLALVTAAESTHDAIEAIAQVIADQRRNVDTLTGTLLDSLATGRAKADAMGQMVDEASDRANRFAEEAAPRLLEALLRVRDTATQAAEHAREVLAKVIPEAAEALEKSGAAALRRAVDAGLDRQIAQIAVTAETAVNAANRAAERLDRQIHAIDTATALVDTRLEVARAEHDEANQESFARRASLLIEALNSAAIDITRTFAPEVADSAWAAYLKGDRGVFTRRAVRLLDGVGQRDIARLYDDDYAFRDQVNRYIHDFESMLRTILTQRDGSPLGVTLLSSDMGKLYVALAQAIERLR